MTSFLNRLRQSWNPPLVDHSSTSLTIRGRITRARLRFGATWRSPPSDVYLTICVALIGSSRNWSLTNGQEYYEIEF